MNAQYKALAYERATLLALIQVAKDKYLTSEGMDEPDVKIETEELPRNESFVPQDSVIDVILRLQKLADSKEKEMGKFNFVRSENSYEQEWQDSPSQASPAQPPTPGGKGKSKGGKGGAQAPAAKGR